MGPFGIADLVELDLVEAILAEGHRQTGEDRWAPPALLRERGVVTRRKAGRIAFYSLADEHVRHVLADALAHTSESTRQERQTA